MILVTLEDMGDDDDDLAKYIYKEYDYGYGEDKSGLMLMLSMAKRDYALIAFGYGNVAFTDHGKDVLMDRHVLPMLAQDEYHSAFLTYLNTANEYLSMAKAGIPFDIGTDEVYQQEKATTRFWINLAITVLVPLSIAGVICFVFLRKMKTAALQQTANNYIPADGFVVTASRDMYLFSTEIRTAIAEKKAGGTSVGNDGFSGKKGKF